VLVAARSFDAVAEEYDAGRPSYPAGVYDALGDLAGRRVLDVGAGTGIATRQLLARDAVVTAIDVGPAVLARAARRTPGLVAVVADGTALPVRDGAADVITFAQSWHWLDPHIALPEVHRALAPGGRLAAWWSQARADEEEWFGAYWAIIEANCPGTRLLQRDVDWGATMAQGPWFDVADPVSVPWLREVSVDRWMVDQASHSYVADLVPDVRTRLLDELRGVLRAHLGGEDVLSVRYETQLWVADRRPSGSAATPSISTS
jgi:SAM-dependent methyltransferase